MKKNTILLILNKFINLGLSIIPIKLKLIIYYINYLNLIKLFFPTNL